jgi:hypothetical protein
MLQGRKKSKKSLWVLSQLKKEEQLLRGAKYTQTAATAHGANQPLFLAFSPSPLRVFCVPVRTCCSDYLSPEKHAGKK